MEQDGLTEDTIIIVTSDHGCGVARYKRMPYDSGLHVPMIMVFPEKYRHLAPKDYVPGGRSDRLIGTIDLAPTMLSLAGIKPPDFYQGHAFAGEHEAPPRSYLHGMRGRMDERYDLMRSTRDKRYVYIRNYNPHKIYGQHVRIRLESAFHAGVGAAIQRRQTEAAADLFLGNQTRRGALRSPDGPGRSEQPGFFRRAQSDPGAVSEGASRL